MSASVPMQENAWNGIKEVSWPEGKNSCDCGADLARLKEVKLSDARERWHCVSCMQRYNVRWIRYANFGMFS